MQRAGGSMEGLGFLLQHQKGRREKIKRKNTADPIDR